MGPTDNDTPKTMAKTIKLKSTRPESDDKIPDRTFEFEDEKHEIDHGEGSQDEIQIIKQDRVDQNGSRQPEDDAGMDRLRRKLGFRLFSKLLPEVNAGADQKSDPDQPGEHAWPGLSQGSQLQPPTTSHIED